MRDRLFFVGLIGFLGGVFIASFLSVNFTFVYLTILLAAGFFAVYFTLQKKHQLFIFSTFFILCLGFGLLRFYLHNQKITDHKLDNFISRSIVVEGVILSEVERKESSQRFTVVTDKVSYLGHEYETRSKILMSVDTYPYFQYGDKIKVSGNLKKPENFTTDIGKEFDYENYLRKDGIFYTMAFAKASLLSSHNGSFVFEKLYHIKHSFLKHIQRVLAPPESSLLSGLLLGVKSGFGDELQSAFIKTGLVHIVVLSGYNITIIAESLIKTLSFASIALSIYFGAFIIVLFTIMVGAGSTILRASTMALIALFARLTGRNYDVVRALLFAGFFMVLWNPMILVFDISFQLSFLATIGLIFMSPVFQEKFKFLPKRFGIREIAASTIGVQLFVLPFILYKMGNLSLIAPITNILVLPFIPVTMLVGFLATSLSFISHIIAFPFSFLVHVLLSFEIFIIELFSKLPFSSLELKYFPFILVIIFYAFVSYKLWKFYQKKNVTI